MEDLEALDVFQENPQESEEFSSKYSRNVTLSPPRKKRSTEFFGTNNAVNDLSPALLRFPTGKFMVGSGGGTVEEPAKMENYKSLAFRRRLTAFSPTQGPSQEERLRKIAQSLKRTMINRFGNLQQHAEMQQHINNDAFDQVR